MTVRTTLPELEHGRARTMARAGSAAWLLILCWPLWSLLDAEPGIPRVAWAFGGAALLAGCWLMITWRMFSSRGGTPRPWALAGLLGATLALLPVLGRPWAYVCFVLVVSALAASLRPVVFTAAVVVTAVVDVIALWVLGAPFAGIWWVPLVIAVQTAVVQSLKQMGVLVARLEAARAEVAQMAIENERLRFARDLHDILGHTLASIIIKSQLAARLARTDPDRAAREMADVEHATRQALDEVRHAVTGYRAPALSEELDKAARGLRAAGIELEVSPAEGPIPASAEILLAWAVREAVTNVLRHSRAGRCWIDLSVDDTAAGLEVRDDGTPPGDGAGAGRAGHGLTGLAERVAEAGGRLEAGSLPGRGYRLCVRVPLEES
ncbi:sensor histidine kinase [Streptosporangium sp. NPDC006013]|uniref:sensor histidine kinase n=1 Tax=Streptosporangium sp. NPDC006013 TaxID=3155596 RepID=UPI0033A79055